MLERLKLLLYGLLVLTVLVFIQEVPLALYCLDHLDARGGPAFISLLTMALVLQITVLLTLHWFIRNEIRHADQQERKGHGTEEG